MSPIIYAPQWILTLLAVGVLGGPSGIEDTSYTPTKTKHSSASLSGSARHKLANPSPAPDCIGSVLPAPSVYPVISSGSPSSLVEDPCQVRSLEGAEVAGTIAYLRVRLTVADPAKCRDKDDREDWQVALVTAGSQQDIRDRYSVSKKHLEVQVPHTQVGDFQLLLREPLPIVSSIFHLDMLKYHPRFSVDYRDSSLKVSFTHTEEKLNASFVLVMTPCTTGDINTSSIVAANVCQEGITLKPSSDNTFLVNGTLVNHKCNYELTLVMWSGVNGTRVRVKVQEEDARGAKRTCFPPPGDAEEFVARTAYVAWWVAGVILALMLLLLTLLIYRRRLLREIRVGKGSLAAPEGGPEVLLVYSRRRLETIVVQALARTLEFHFGCQVKDLYSYSDPVRLTAPQSWVASKVTCPSSKVLLVHRLSTSSMKPSYARDPSRSNGTQHKRELDKDDQLFRYTLQSLREAELSSSPSERVFVAKIHVQETLARDFVVDDEVEDEEETLNSSVPGARFLLPQHMALLGAALRGRNAKDEEVPLCVEDPANFPHLTLALGPATTPATTTTTTTTDALEVVPSSHSLQCLQDAVTL